MKIARVIDRTGSEVYTEYKNGKYYRLSLNSRDGKSEKLKANTRSLRPKSFLPAVDVRTIICIGLNYRKHAMECNLPIPEYPVVFMKNPSAVTGHLENIFLPEICDYEVDYECELAVVIGKDCKNATTDNALDFVAGYTIANDVSSRIWQMQKGGSQWVRSKSFDSFCPLGPWLVTKDEIPDPDNLKIKTELNGKVVQNSNTSDMIFGVRELICFLSKDTTLQAGTVILTGTPEGIGWTREPRRMLEKGDEIRISIEGIGELVNTVA